jgi:hypothetical protein
MKGALLRRTTVLWTTQVVVRPIYGFFSLISEKCYWRGIRIEHTIDGVTQGDRDALISALELVEEVSPWHVTHLYRRARAIVIERGVATDFAPLMRLAMVDVHDLRQLSRESLAAKFVGISVLARLSRHGWWRDLRLRPRMNRLALERSLDFARRLRDPAELIEALTQEFQTTGWRITSVGDNAAQFYEREKAPRWLVRLSRFWLRQLDS